jgi:hypothetical protein
MKNTIFNKYKTAELIPFSFKLGTKANGQKDISELPTHGDILKYTPSLINKNKTGHAIRTGTAYKDKFIIGIDIDNKPNNELCLDGLTKWKELMNINYTITEEAIEININNTFDINNICIDKELKFLNTPTQKTGNGGYHYLFLVDAEMVQIIKGGCTGLNIDNSFKKYAIDVKLNNGFLISEPSKYDNKFYKWIKAPTDTPILDIPIWLFNIIKENKEPTKKAIIKQAENEIQKKAINKDAPMQYADNDIIYQYINCISINRYNSYGEWIKILQVFKNNNLSFDVFLQLTRRSKFYETDEYIINKWNSFKQNNGYSLKTLYSMAKNDNVKEFNKIYSIDKRQKNINKLFDTSNYNFIDINKKYIIDGSESDNIIFDNINKWMTDNTIKSLNIKSQYGSGKTQLIKTILDKYTPERVLWVSYRQTLTDNIEGEFKKYNFKNYLNRVYDGNYQLIQLESLENLRHDNDNGDDVYMVPEYDIIIIDEIESVLNHFNASTFKHDKSKEVYNYLYDIIKVSKKLLLLDGDMAERSYSYALNFGDMININNKYNTNERQFNIIQNEDIFLNKLYEDIATAKKDNKKIGICSMSKSETIKYNNLINEHFNKNMLDGDVNEIKILLINAESDDVDKKKLKNIQAEIIKYDVFIYSPTVEAGVNIDMAGIFNNLYCIICGGSTSPRAFLQMTARIRHINNNIINVLNTSLYNNENCNFWDYDDAKELMKINSELLIERQTQQQPDNKIIETFKLSPYMQTKIFNKVEVLNNNSYYFIKLLGILCTKKGIKITFDMNADEKVKIKLDTTDIIQELIDIKYITAEQESIIQSKINNRTATTHDKLIMTNKYFCKLCNIYKLDETIIKNFYKKESEIKNYINLIDDSQLKGGSILRINIIKNLIKQLGYNSVYDTSEIKEDIFNINLLNIIKEKDNKYNCIDLIARKAFSMAKFDTNINLIETIDGKTRKPLMGHINSLLKRYCLKVSLYQRRETSNSKDNKSNFYMLEHLKNIDEIVYYKKLNKHCKIIDTSNNINFDTYKFIYKELRTGETQYNIIDDVFIDDDVLINNIEELDKGIEIN